MNTAMERMLEVDGSTGRNWCSGPQHHPQDQIQVGTRRPTKSGASILLADIRELFRRVGADLVMSRLPVDILASGMIQSIVSNRNKGIHLISA